ncbi:hypothetical protein [Motiliproteus sp. SC1-56]|uniref:hypothetical protein n=1 Tax=Motiliproteus sp. SC1-56 TaxID=2799565 RepID=UPI001A8D1035|nr:hypothetical protein [Motiliproteus sp. SC1-56]
MTPEQYRATRLWFGCSVAEWTQLLGISRSLHGKLTGGFVDVSRQTEQLIRALLAHRQTQMKLAELEEQVERAGVREQLCRF